MEGEDYTMNTVYPVEMEHVRHRSSSLENGRHGSLRGPGAGRGRIHEEEEEHEVPSIQSPPPAATLSKDRPSKVTTITHLPRPIDVTTIPAPPITFHRSAIITVLRIILISALIPGISLWLTLTICITVNVGYTTFSMVSDEPSHLTLFYLIAFAFYLDVMCRVIRSLTRTALRMGITIWQCRFGAGSVDIWPARVIDRTVLAWPRWLLRLVLWVDSVPTDLKSGASTAQQRQEEENAVHVVITSLGELDVDKLDRDNVNAKFYRRVENLKLFLVGILFFACLVGPPLILTLIDFWAAVGWLCAIYALGSFILIGTVNVVARVVRMLRYLKAMWQDTIHTDRLRAMYVATTHFDKCKVPVRRRLPAEVNNSGKGDIISLLADRLIIGGFVVFIASIILSSMRVLWGPSLICGVFFFAGLCLRYRKRFPPYRESTTLHKYLENVLPYNGQAVYPAIVLLTSRMIFYACGISCLVALDIGRIALQTDIPVKWRSFIDMESISRTALATFTPIFFVLFFLRDILFLIPQRFIPGRIRAVLLFTVTAGMIGLTIAYRASYALYTQSVTLFVAIYSLDVRDAKAYWHKAAQPASVSLPNMRRAVRTSFLILSMLVSSLVISTVVGLAFNAGLSVPPEKASVQRNWTVTPAFCNPTFPYPAAAPLDLHAFISLSIAAYSGDPLTELQPTFKRLNLAATLVNVSIPGDVRFYHLNMTSTTNPAFPPLQIVAIRGTFGIHDVFQDIYLWSSPALLRFSSYFGTFFALWPQRTLAEVVRLLYRYAANPSLTYYFTVEDYVSTLASTNPGSVFVTGHSLGGGLALLAGASANIPAVTFSAPGLASSYLAFGISDKQYFMTGSVNTYLDGDPVPILDLQVGPVVLLPCGNGVHLGGTKCHESEQIRSQIAAMCQIS
ncbi:hypothetical protein DFS34DRAFT_624856 [Phlyctochytrium arcticum]|nr:hypothetical protein DFS34DRAFT_624856 [Phlyctochytrium arcticum]